MAMSGELKLVSRHRIELGAEYGRWTSLQAVFGETGSPRLLSHLLDVHDQSCTACTEKLIELTDVLTSTPSFTFTEMHGDIHSSEDTVTFKTSYNHGQADGHTHSSPNDGHHGQPSETDNDRISGLGKQTPNLDGEPGNSESDYAETHSIDSSIDDSPGNRDDHSGYDRRIVTIGPQDNAGNCASLHEYDRPEHDRHTDSTKLQNNAGNSGPLQKEYHPGYDRHDESIKVEDSHEDDLSTDNGQTKSPDNVAGSTGSLQDDVGPDTGYMESPILDEDAGITDALQKDVNIGATAFASSETFIKEINSISPMDMDVEMAPYHCGLCGKGFTKRNSLYSHVRRHTVPEEKKFKCDECEKSFARPSYLASHKHVHTGVKPHTCPICGRGFSQKNCIRLHMLVHSKEMKYTCDVCGRSFKRKDSLTGHLRVHTGERPFKCSICNKSFSGSGSRTKHMRLHTGETPFKCPLCDMAFSCGRKRTLHMNTHTGEKPYKCDVCEMAFVQKAVRDRHFLTHTGERPHTCDVCDKSFTQKNVLTTHMRVHTGERPYLCEICGMAFAYKTSRNMHRQQCK